MSSRVAISLAVVNVLIWVMIAYETATYDERRRRLRHGLDIEPPSGFDSGRRPVKVAVCDSNTAAIQRFDAMATHSARV
jgi:hypothetical protein